VLELLHQLTYQGEQEMIDLSELADTVATNTDVTASAAILLAQLADIIEQTGGDQEALNELVATLRADDASLAEAVAANTPATPEEPPVDPPVEEPPAEEPPFDPDVPRPA
jgi:hypothetical protein